MFEGVVAQHFDYLQVNSRDDDLIIIGLYSHGLEKKLIIRLGKEATHAVTPNALKKFLDPRSFFDDPENHPIPRLYDILLSPERRCICSARMVSD